MIGLDLVIAAGQLFILSVCIQQRLNDPSLGPPQQRFGGFLFAMRSQFARAHDGKHVVMVENSRFKIKKRRSQLGEESRDGLAAENVQMLGRLELFEKTIL